MAPRVGVVAQARMASTRLPGKMMMKIFDRPLLDLFLERMMRIKGVDEFILTTSTSPENDQLVPIAEARHCQVFRGSENDVLSRYYHAALDHQLDVIIRVTADCPLIDPDLISEHLQKFLNENKWDYWSLSTGPLTEVIMTYPHGLDFEIFRFSALKEAFLKAQKPEDREHVSSYITDHSERFQVHRAPYRENLSYHRVTVDYPADFELVKKIYEALYENDPEFSWQDFVRFLEGAPPFKIGLAFELTTESGGGHEVRTRSVGASLEKKGVRPDYFSGHLSLDSILNWLKINPVDALVLDSYYVTEALIAGLRREHLLMPIILFRDFEHDGTLEADFALRFFAENLKFLPLREGLVLEKLRKSSPVRDGIFLCFGGSDPEAQTLRLINILKAMPNFESIPKIKVVLGALFGDPSPIVKALENNPRFSLYQNPSNIDELMNQSAAAITSGGLLAFEISFLVLPQLVIPLAENQEKSVELLKSNPLATVLQRHDQVSNQKLQSSLTEFFRSIKTFSQHANLWSLDGKGAKRSADEILRAVSSFHLDHFSVETVKTEYEESSTETEEFKKVRWGSNEGMRNRFLIAESKIAWNQVKHWCDIGCGTATFLEEIEKRHSMPEFTGWDLSPSLLRFAQSKQHATPKLHWQLANFLDPTVGGQFDLVTALGVVQKCGASLPKAIAALSQRLVSGGQIFITTKNADWEELTSGHLQPEATHHWFTIEEIRWAFRRAGLKIKELGGFEPRTAKLCKPEASHSVFVYAIKE